MCGSATTTSTRHNQKPSHLPDRHQVRHAIRKVARTMRKEGFSVNVYDVKLRIMAALDSSSMTQTEYDKTWSRVNTSLDNTTFFQTHEGGCGGTTLTVRKSASL